jgi:hypothetical protein
VQHHYFRHGQRYKVNRGNEMHLAPATAKGRKKIRSWMALHKLDVTSFEKQIDLAKTKRAIGELVCLR